MFGAANYPVDPFTLCGPGAIMHTHTHTHSYTQPYACPPAPCPPPPCTPTAPVHCPPPCTPPPPDPPSDLDDRLKRIEALLQACAAPKEDPDPVDPVVDPCLLDCLETCADTDAGTDTRVCADVEADVGTDALSCDSVMDVASACTSASGTWVAHPDPRHNPFNGAYSYIEAFKDKVGTAEQDGGHAAIEAYNDALKCMGGVFRDMLKYALQTMITTFVQRRLELRTCDRLRDNVVTLRGEIDEIRTTSHTQAGKINLTVVVTKVPETDIRRHVYKVNGGCPPYPAWVSNTCFVVPSMYAELYNSMMRRYDTF